MGRTYIDQMMSSLTSTIHVFTSKALNIPKLSLTHSKVADGHASQREDVGEEEEEEVVTENEKFSSSR